MWSFAVHRLRNVGPLLVALLALGPVAPAVATDPEHEHRERPHPLRAAEVRRNAADHHDEPQALAAMSSTPCVSGFAGAYPCDDVSLLSFLPLSEIGGGLANDIWGWTDGSSGRQFALLGRTTGTSFVEVTDPVNPVYLGNLPTNSLFSSTWRDIKVHADHAFIVSEARNHEMQIFDLTQLLSVSSPPVTFTATAQYGGFRTAHNIAINEETGYAYAVGTNVCSGGLHIVDLSTPTSPVTAGCEASDGYTHDTQCVVYGGPDAAHQGSEICFSSNEDTLTIVDVTNKSAALELSRTAYPGVSYTHQGWLTEDHAYFLLGDEGDEQDFGHATRTRIFDVSDLENPFVLATYDGTTPAIDHNMYAKDGFLYQANYRAGLQILDLANIASGILQEVAYFDVYPADDAASFDGAWSVYPYFDDGIIVVSGIEQGLFVLSPQLPRPPSVPTLGGPARLVLTGLLLAGALRGKRRASPRQPLQPPREGAE